MTTKRNDLDPARASVWITFAWTVLAITLLCVLALLSACGGGIDTIDEREVVTAPPAATHVVGAQGLVARTPPKSDKPTVPQPCPIEQGACQPPPFREGGGP